MSKREPSLLLNDIIDSSTKILNYTEGMTFESFRQDPKTIDAVIRNFEIIGEAANRLPDANKEYHPDIDWFKIRGVRNRIVHDYMGIDYGIVWQIREQFLPVLIKNLRDISE
jgi:uncharacterized protein with HEPN domain